MSVALGRKYPRLIKKIVRQQKNKLNGQNETDEAFLSHEALDSPTRTRDCAKNGRG
jgi:hypothetical protein